MLRIPYYLDSRLTDSREVANPTRWPRSPHIHFLFQSLILISVMG
jgi:hypothetical protein